MDASVPVAIFDRSAPASPAVVAGGRDAAPPSLEWGCRHRSPTFGRLVMTALGGSSEWLLAASSHPPRGRSHLSLLLAESQV